MCTNLCETCIRSGRHGLGSVRSNDMPIVGVIVLVLMFLFAMIGVRVLCTWLGLTARC